LAVEPGGLQVAAGGLAGTGGVELGGAAVAGPVGGLVELGGAGAGGGVRGGLQLAVAGEHQPAVGDQAEHRQQPQHHDQREHEDLPVLTVAVVGGGSGTLTRSHGRVRLRNGSIGSSWRAVSVTWPGSSRRVGRSLSRTW
jgi:hypothetical protein